MRFEKYNFHPGLLKSIAEAGFTKSTDIQFRAIPPVLKGEDVLAVAQTGTGKTAAFVIPAVHLLTSGKRKTGVSGIRCLVMVPTRELAIQINGVFEQMGKYTSLRTLSVFGGVEQDAQIAALLHGTDVLVATPGRMFDLISQGFVKLDSLEMLILDEADRMLDPSFIRDIRYLDRFLPQKRQTLFFSATINAEIKKLAYSLVNNPIRIQVSPRDPVSKNIDHAVAHISMDDKRFFLERLIRENPESKVLVFVRTKVRAERVAKALERAGVRSETIHGDKDQRNRNIVLDEFRKGALKVLVATDVSARGIDIPEVGYVVNYDLPENPEIYIHRIGRTGRGKHKGYAVSFCSPAEEDLLEDIAELVGRKINVIGITARDYEETLDFSDTAPKDWRALLKEEEKVDSTRKSKKSRR